MAQQSPESQREHGPYAVCAPDAPTRVAEWPLPDLTWLDLAPPPSSNGPAALRGEALARTLAALR